MNNFTYRSLIFITTCTNSYEFRVAVVDAINSISFSGFHFENISISMTVLQDSLDFVLPFVKKG